MEDLLIGLKEIYYPEQPILKSLPKMLDKATNNQVERLEKAFEKLGNEPRGTQCPAIDGIVKDADETAGEIEDKAVLDAASSRTHRRSSTTKSAAMGTLIAWAEKLGHDGIALLATGRQKTQHRSTPQGRQR